MHRPMDLSHRIARILESKASAEAAVKVVDEDPELADPGGRIVGRLDQCPVCLGKKKLACRENCFRCHGQGVVAIEK